MTKNESSKSAIMKNAILGKIASVIGWVIYQGCGETNKIEKGKGGDCEFCGSPLL